MKKLIFILMSCLFLATDCKNGDDFPPCELPPDAFTTGFAFQLVSSNGQTLIGESGTLYESKDVRLEDPDGNTPPKSNIGSDGTIGLVAPDNNDTTGVPIEKLFFLILPPTGINPDWDVDTISTTYQLKLTECNFFWFDSYEVIYNDSLYYKGEFPVDIIKFIKR